MKKFKIISLTFLLTPILAGLYGILHDQFTYTISPEYFTKFKFIQFRLMNEGKLIFPNVRFAVAIVGFFATWWTGIIIGIAHALIGLIHRDTKTMQHSIVNAISINIAITVITGLIGLVVGWLYLANSGVSWPLPDDLIEKRHFLL